MADTNPDLSRSGNTTPSSLFTSISGQKRSATNWLPAKRKNSNKRVKSSWIYRHGQPVRKEGEDTIYWKCGLCNKDPYKATSTTSSEYHLEKNHTIFEYDTTTVRSISVLEQQQRAAIKRADPTLSFLDLLVRWTECERVFSSCKLLVPPNRNKLGAQAIEANECLRSWFRQEILD